MSLPAGAADRFVFGATSVAAAVLETEQRDALLRDVEYLDRMQLLLSKQLVHVPVREGLQLEWSLTRVLTDALESDLGAAVGLHVNFR